MKKIYDFSNLRGDLIGGLIAGIVALPLALAFGVQSGLGAVSGLYGAIAIGVLAAIFGGTATQASGPTGPMTVISAALVVAAIEYTGSLDSALGIILLTFFLGGVDSNSFRTIEYRKIHKISSVSSDFRFYERRWIDHRPSANLSFRWCNCTQEYDCGDHRVTPLLY